MVRISPGDLQDSLFLFRFKGLAVYREFNHAVSSASVHHNRVQRADVAADPTTDAGIDVDDVGLLPLAADGFLWALLGAQGAACAKLRIDGERDQRAADAGWTLFVPDVSIVFVAEVADR
jgi:hypothetical protein